MRTNLLVSGGALLAGCLLLEAAVRWSGIAFEPQYDRRGMARLVESEDPDIGRELPPNFDGPMMGGHVVTNSFGMRGPEVSVEKPPGTFRIAVLGDSWAFGWGVAQEEAFPAVLERVLREAGGDHIQFEVLNFSVWAYNTEQELAVLRRKALRFHPDIVLVAYNINDVEPRAGEGGPSAERLLRRIETGLNRGSHLFRLVDSRLRSLALKMALERTGKVEHYQRLYAPGSPAWERTRHALSEIHQAATAAGAATYLVLCPWMNLLEEDNPYRNIHLQVLSEAAALGIPARDLFEDFRGRDAAALRISPLDGHPRGEGHRIAALAIADDLQARGLIPPAIPVRPPAR